VRINKEKDFLFRGQSGEPQSGSLEDSSNLCGRRRDKSSYIQGGREDRRVLELGPLKRSAREYPTMLAD